LLVGIILVSLLQIVGVGSILPLLDVIADPDGIDDQVVVAYISEFIEFTDTNSIVIFLASMSFVLIVVSNVVTAITVWFTFRFVWSVQSRLSTELLARYMAHPYEVLLGRNPAEAEKNVLEEVLIFTNGVMRPMLRLVASGVVVVFLIAFLVWFNPVMAGIAVAFLGGGYVATFVFVRRRLSSAGNRRIVSNENRFRAVGEAIGGIKEIQVLGRSEEFIDRYRVPAQEYARATALQNIIADIPRYAIEVLAFGSIMIVALYVAASSGNLSDIAPIISVYALAGYRLIPAMQKVYSDWSGIRFNKVVVEPLHLAHVAGEESRRSHIADDTGSIDIEKGIRLTDLEYRYPGSTDLVIGGLNMTIQRGHTVSFIGETGSGKTTLVELLIGILRPTSGSISVDDVVLDAQNMRRWQNSIGYVQQEIFLIDDTISANIALGVPRSEIDDEAVRWAAEVANIDKFVTQQLPERYETTIGSRGVRLSGGQRQRIGIARALYHRPAVLFMDEATSNLDQETEQLLHQTLQRVSGDMTVVIVAHRLKTTRASDVIYVLEKGHVIGSGKYDEIVNPDGSLLAEFSTQRTV
jgi:ABC-type bacteriocin/lantibiotic exporter with double-glycine peptidase domain